MEEIIDELKQDKLYFESEDLYKKAMRKKQKKAKVKKVEVEEEEEEVVEKPKKKKKIAKA